MKKNLYFLFFLFCIVLTSLFAAEENNIEEEELELIAAASPQSNSSNTSSHTSSSHTSSSAGPSASNFTQEKAIGPNSDNFIDPKILRDFVESKGLIECRQKEGRLTIAGDVRARWLATGEKVNGISQRHFKSDHAVNVFKSEVNLFFDYTTPKAWVTTKLKWGVIDGIDGGSLTKVDLDRAFIGYDIYEKGCEDFYLEVGRSKFDYMFESRVEFASFFDGIHLFYTNKYEGTGVFTIHGGPFIIDSLTNHYGWVVETGFKQLGGTDFSVKYSLVDWLRFAPTYDYGKNKGEHLVRDNPRYRFLVSQLILGHEQKIDFPGCKMLYLYAAVLANHAAQKSRTVPSYENKAWYAGFTLGKLCKACDWSVDINYQWVQAQSIPEFDLSGIGHGNAANLLLSDAILALTSPSGAIGFTNYQGFEMLGLYALTDSLTLRAKASWSKPIDIHLGGDFTYKNFEMAVIFAF